MAVRIRLARVGRRNRPYYRIVAIDSRRARDSRALEVLGAYDPLAKDAQKTVRLDADRIRHWLRVGAQPSDTVRSFLRHAKIGKDSPQES